MTRKLAGLISALLLDGTSSSGGGTAPPPPPPPPPAADPSEGFKAALAKHNNDATALARSSWESAERLRTERDDALGRLPRAGAVVLEGDDLAEWNAYKGLGRKAAEVKADLDRLPELDGRLKAHDRAKHLGEVSRACGSDGKPLNFDAEVLAQLAGPDLRIDLKAGKAGVKDVQLAEVVETAKGADGKDVETRTPLDKFAAARWAKFLPSLKAVPAAATPAQAPPTSRLPVTTPPGGGGGGGPAPRRRSVL